MWLLGVQTRNSSIATPTSLPVHFGEPFRTQPHEARVEILHPSLQATDSSYNGADHIFSSSGVSVLWKGASVSALKVEVEEVAAAGCWVGVLGAWK